MKTEVFVRHSRDCQFKDNRYYPKCNCRKWIYILSKDRSPAKRVSAQTRSWEKAADKAKAMEADGVAISPDRQTISAAIDAFLQTRKSVIFPMAPYPN